MNSIDRLPSFTYRIWMIHQYISISDVILVHESVKILLSFDNYPVKSGLLKPEDHVIVKCFFGLYTSHKHKEM